MAIRFTQRLTRLVRADAHGIIESLEDRALLLKQHLREAELELQRKRARREDETRTLDEDTRLALEGEREDLARFAIRKLLPKRSEAATLRGRIDEIRAERERLAPKLEEQEAEFEELRGRVREKLAAETRATESESPCAEWRVAEEEVEMELLRRMRAAGGTK